MAIVIKKAGLNNFAKYISLMIHCNPSTSLIIHYYVLQSVAIW